MDGRKAARRSSKKKSSRSMPASSDSGDSEKATAKKNRTGTKKSSSKSGASKKAKRKAKAKTKPKRPAVTSSASDDGIPVILHIYTASKSGSIQRVNRFTKDIVDAGGVFHGGVEVLGKEYSFGWTPSGTGVYSTPPGENEMHEYREAIRMGRTSLTKKEVTKILKTMAQDWTGDSYDLIRKNCCHFCEAFCSRLGVGGLPAWVNRFANTGAVLQDRARQVLDASGVILAAGKRMGARLRDGITDATTTAFDDSYSSEDIVYPQPSRSKRALRG